MNDLGQLTGYATVPGDYYEHAFFRQGRRRPEMSG
jgi:hypothetical protein